MWWWHRVRGACFLDSDNWLPDSLGFSRCENVKWTCTRWFKVTVLSPSWRSLSLWKGHVFTIPKRSAAELPGFYLRGIGRIHFPLPWEYPCTSSYGKYPFIYSVLYIPGGAGFLPSTVLVRFWWSEFVRINGHLMFPVEGLAKDCKPASHDKHILGAAKTLVKPQWIMKVKNRFP